MANSWGFPGNDNNGQPTGTGFLGSLLTGMAQGMQNQSQTAQNLDFLKQSRSQELVAGQLANQSNALKLQQQHAELDQAEAVNNFAKQAFSSPGDVAGNTLAGTDNSTPPQQGQQIAGQMTPNAPRQTGTTPNPFQGGNDGPQAGGQQGPAGGTQTGTGMLPGTSTSGMQPGGSTSGFKPMGKYSAEQYAEWDRKYGFPPGKSYALLATESSGGVDNYNPQSGATGPGQILPATAKHAGYGIPDNLDANDPESGFKVLKGYVDAAGGDFNKGLAYYYLGPKAAQQPGALQSPSMQGYLGKNAKYTAQYNAGMAAKQADNTPTPADHVETQERAGVTQTPVSMGQAVDAQSRMIAGYERAAQNAAAAGNVPAAQTLMARADALRGQQLDLAGKRNSVQKSANEAVATLTAGVTDQRSWDAALTQIGQNPAMHSALAGLKITGNFDLDRPAIATLASRTQTLKDQQELQIKQQDQQLKEAKNAREQQEFDRKQVQEQQARDTAAADKQVIAQQEDQRRTANLASGMPYVPGYSKTLPQATTPAVAAKVAATNDKAWADRAKGTETAITGAKNVAQISADIAGKVRADPSLVGGGITAFQAEHPWMLNAQQQEILKNTNSLVVEMQRSAPPGAQRSAATAAMGKVFATTKPNLSLKPEAFIDLSDNLYYGAQAQVSMDDWMNRFHQANPSATVEQGRALYGQYERSLGAPYWTDKDGVQHINRKSVARLPDGRDNPEYVSPDSYFSNVK